MLMWMVTVKFAFWNLQMLIEQPIFKILAQWLIQKTWNKDLLDHPSLQMVAGDGSLFFHVSCATSLLVISIVAEVSQQMASFLIDRLHDHTIETYAIY